MISKLTINNLKSIERQSLDLCPLTILTGLNSTGKSTCFQAVLAALYHSSSNTSRLLDDMDFTFETLRNRNVNAKDLSIRFDWGEDEVAFRLNAEGAECVSSAKVSLEDDIFYLSANRLGFSDMETVSTKNKVGIAGEYLFGTFEQEKSTPVDKGLLLLSDSETLSSHINYWLTYILGIKFEMQTEKVTQTKVKVVYKSDDLPNLSPQQLGVGVSYLVKTLIMCLRSKAGNVLMIENPELHLHPAAQARLGEFFAYIAKAGIQVLLETHCEHLINKLQYQIYKGRFAHDDAVIYYKGGITTPFETIHFTKGGKFAEPFPDGFFDATLEELLEIE
ncbi:AAA family ATPase [Phocaeicola vulgatus]|uniref:AAA family ATPase n=1 Tax=Phocaeicola vulgatus TaxID=821 RepID=UPI001E5FF67D|nr:AAA family ATPase [Phocaeicola vulgatus]BDC06912.1 hypothetical protein GAIMETA21S03_27950 [Phocaeicola vulgatus]BDC11046.1 hypothetical protein GAIMETA21S07_28340 [Phocaeicola vulgatus]BDC15215.1 hypothetical protein GAIMETA21S10_29790 [Phocaeicola vulgatus]